MKNTKIGYFGMYPVGSQFDTLEINQVKTSLNNPACELFKTDGVSMVPYWPFPCAQKQSPSPKLAPHPATSPAGIYRKL